MQILFVHGLGRSPLCGAALLRQLRSQGCQTSNFSYLAALESVDSITARLVRSIRRMASKGDYVLIGHSLGGVLLRLALRSLPGGTRLPRRLILIASPIKSSRLARWSRSYRLYRMFGNDCGALLASAKRMAEIGRPPVPTLCFIGTRSPKNTRRAFPGEASDGVLSLSEVYAPWAQEIVRIADDHLNLPSNAQLIERVCLHLAQLEELSVSS
jgi:pimeloyl-ACP methyl ester carboxylesterase